VQTQWESGAWVLTGGLRHTRLKVGVRDRFLSNGDDSGGTTYNGTAPVIGVLRKVSPAHYQIALIVRAGQIISSIPTDDIVDPRSGLFSRLDKWVIKELKLSDTVIGPLLKKLDLSKDEKRAVLAFLESLEERRRRMRPPELPALGDAR
jgi:hypothetical protein